MVMIRGGDLVASVPQAGAIGRDPDLGGMLDNNTPVELRELDRHAASEMPGAVSAGKEIGHNRNLLDELLDGMLDVFPCLQSTESQGIRQVSALSKKFFWQLERAKGIEPSYAAWEVAYEAAQRSPAER